MLSNPYLPYEGSTFKIVVYADPKTRLRPQYVEHALKRDLARTVEGKPTELISVNRHDFAQSVTGNPNAIIIPENMGPISHHMRDFSSESVKNLRNYARNGGTVVMFGGASHYAMSDIEWFWDNGEVHYKGPKETFSFVNGSISGPHIRNKPSFFTPVAHNGCFEVPLVVEKDNGSKTIETVWQGNCGAFDIRDHDHTVLAHYQEIDSKHVAAVDVSYGRNGGRFILCSVMPHYKPRIESPLWDAILKRIETSNNKKVVSSPSSVLKTTP